VLYGSEFPVRNYEQKYVKRAGSDGNLGKKQTKLSKLKKRSAEVEVFLLPFFGGVSDIAENNFTCIILIGCLPGKKSKTHSSKINYVASIVYVYHSLCEPIDSSTSLGETAAARLLHGACMS
jgi:hypothetical protein